MEERRDGFKILRISNFVIREQQEIKKGIQKFPDLNLRQGMILEKYQTLELFLSSKN